MKLIQLLILLLISQTLVAQEIAQWRGPNRNGIYPAKELLKEWPANGPELILEIDSLGAGFSTAVVYKDVIYVTGKIDSTDYISAIKMNGELIWRKKYSTAWTRTYPDSRCTPTIENNKIYLIGGSANMVCMDATNGNIIWENNPHKDFRGKYMHWGVVESVLLTNDAALYITGGDNTTMVALNKQSGELLWKTKSIGGSKPYASSLLINRNGLQIALVQTSDDLVGIDVSNGNILWVYNMSQYHTDNKGKGEAANTPIYHDGGIFVTYGNQQKGLMLSLSEDGKSVKLKWLSDILDTHHGGLVLINGYLYASNMINNSQGLWACVNWETGKTNWETEWITKGSIIAADGMLYLYEDRSGNVALVKPNPNKFDLVSTFKIDKGTGPHWAHPSIYDWKLFIRHGDSLLIYEVSKDTK